MTSDTINTDISMGPFVCDVEDLWPLYLWILMFALFTLALASLWLSFTPMLPHVDPSMARLKVIVDSLQIFAIFSFFQIRMHHAIRNTMYILSFSFLNLELVAMSECTLSRKNLLFGQLLLPLAFGFWLACVVGVVYICEHHKLHHSFCARWMETLDLSTGAILSFINYQYISLSYFSFYLASRYEWGDNFYENIALLVSTISALLYGLLLPLTTIASLYGYSLHSKLESYIYRSSFFLFPYRDEVKIFFELISVSRKIAYAALAVWVTGNDYLQPLIAIVVCACWSILVMTIQPYKNTAVNKIELTSSALQIAFLLAGVPPISDDGMDEPRGYGSYVVSALIAILSLTTTIFVFRQMRKAKSEATKAIVVVAQVVNQDVITQDESLKEDLNSSGARSTDVVSKYANINSGVDQNAVELSNLQQQIERRPMQETNPITILSTTRTSIRTTATSRSDASSVWSEHRGLEHLNPRYLVAPQRPMMAWSPNLDALKQETKQ